MPHNDIDTIVRHHNRQIDEHLKPKSLMRSIGARNQFRGSLEPSPLPPQQTISVLPSLNQSERHSLQPNQRGGRNSQYLLKYSIDAIQSTQIPQPNQVASVVRSAQNPFDSGLSVINQEFEQEDTNTLNHVQIILSPKDSCRLLDSMARNLDFKSKKQIQSIYYAEKANDGL